MEIWGHRGAAGIEPENTIRSFKKAIELKVSRIEFDVRMTSDKEIVIFHDHNLKRIFGVHQNINHLTLQELKDISVPAGKEIPTLKEALLAINIPISVDVKHGGFEQLLMQQLNSFTSDVIISSGFPQALEKIRALDGKVKLGLTIIKGEFHLLSLTSWLTKKINLYSIYPERDIVNRASIKIMRRLNRKVFVWTVNDKKRANELKKIGVDSIITDCPNIFN